MMLADAFGSAQKLKRNIMFIIFSQQILIDRFLQVVIDKTKKKFYFLNVIFILFFKCKITY